MKEFLGGGWFLLVVFLGVADPGSGGPLKWRTRIVSNC